MLVFPVSCSAELKRHEIGIVCVLILSDHRIWWPSINKVPEAIEKGIPKLQ